MPGNGGALGSLSSSVPRVEREERALSHVTQRMKVGARPDDVPRHASKVGSADRGYRRGYRRLDDLA